MADGARTDIAIVVNGARHRVSVRAAESLLRALREDLGLTGAKPSCESGQCGACTVLLDGSPVRSCLVPAGRVDGSTVETVEGLAGDEGLNPLQRAFVAHGALQCGYCTSGILVRLEALLREVPDPNEERIRGALASNLCRCTGYEKIVEAARAAVAGPTEPPGAGSFGDRVPQLQAEAKVRGRQRFATDVTVPGMVHAKILRSPHAHALIRSIDVSGAWDVEGVVDVITFADVPEQPYNSALRNPNDLDTLRPDEHVLNGKARYHGDRIAAVAAETLQAAVDALARIEVDWELLPPVLDPVAALEHGAPEIHEGTGNEAAEPKVFSIGDAERALEESEVRVSGVFASHGMQHANMEPKAVIAEWEDDGRLTVRATTQVPFHIRTVLPKALGIPESQARVIALDMGGGQGERSDPADEYVAVLLAQRTGRPVRMVNTREEQFTSTRVRHHAVVESHLGARRDGSLTARLTRATVGTGGYATMGYRVMLSLGIRSAALYRVPDLRYEGRLAYTTTPVGGGMRGFGSPQAAFAIETQMDQLAEELGMDPIDLRMKNLVLEGDEYLDLGPGWRIASAKAIEGLRVARERCDWDRRRRELGVACADGLLRGIGVAVGSHISTVMPYYRDHGDAEIQLHENGTVRVLVGVPDTGTGSTTVFAQIAAEVLGLSAAEVRVTTGDTDAAPYDQGAHSSRTTYVAGQAVQRAAEDLRAQLVREAAAMLEANEDDIEMRGGLIAVRGAPEASVGLDGLGHWLRYESSRPRRLVGKGAALPTSVAPPYAVCVAEVAIDPDTGVTRVERMFEAIDCGAAVNPMFVEGQLHGAIQMGIGAALCEELVFDGDGRLASSSFGTYPMLRAPDMPAIDVAILESHEPTGPFGAKGLGEASIVPVAPAVANAIAHATGRHPTELPVTPERMLALLEVI